MASRAGTWQAPAMARPNSSAAGGALIALGTIAGAVIGFLFMEATRGVLLGFALGVVAAVLVWLRDRRR